MSVVETGASISNSRPARRRAQDPDHSKPLAGSSGGTDTIVVKDDDDEVQISSPRSIALAKRRSRRNRHVRGSTGDYVDVELRLSTSGGTGPSLMQETSLASPSKRVTGGVHCGVSRSTTIDLTSGNDDDVSHKTSRKRKLVQLAPEAPKDVQFTCTICMDTMKEETSTVCGHIFCRVCILGAIRAQKKCPACRRKLTSSNVHRIYLSSGSR